MVREPDHLDRLQDELVASDAEIVQRVRASRSGGGGKLSRSETVTVRLDPKLNYLCELGARAQRRTKSSFIEWAVDHALQSVTVPGTSSIIGEWGDRLWDVDEAERLIELAENFPSLMTHEEQLMWKVIRSHPYFWPGEYDSTGHWRWRARDGLCFAGCVRQQWEVVQNIADGSGTASDLPSMELYRAPDDQGDFAVPF